jgi:endonuclease G
MAISPEELEKAERALESVRKEWLQKPGVTAVDLGFKWKGGHMTTAIALRVHVVRKKLKIELNETELFPEEINGFPVDVIEATYAAQTNANAKPEMAVEGRGKRFDEIPLGVSVGSRYATAGTLGAKVIDQATGSEMILSNWHVLAGRRNVEPGLPIWQPGWIDGGTRVENTIAELSRWVLGPYDAAVARLNGARKVKAETVEGRPINNITKPKLGMKVWKSGRSTGLTEGFVDGVRMTVPILYPGVGTRFLQGVFRIIPRPGSIRVEMSIGGDSGSVWVDEESGDAIGLHFAGETGNSPEHALAHDINLVLSHLKVKIASKTSGRIPRPDRRKSPPKQDRDKKSDNFWRWLSFYLQKWFVIKK